MKNKKIWHYDVDGKKVWGPNKDLWGDVSGLRGDVSRIFSDTSGPLKRKNKTAGVKTKPKRKQKKN
jgi:hypothetical protein